MQGRKFLARFNCIRRRGRVRDFVEAKIRRAPVFVHNFCPTRENKTVIHLRAVWVQLQSRIFCDLRDGWQVGSGSVGNQWQFPEKTITPSSSFLLAFWHYQCLRMCVCAPCSLEHAMLYIIPSSLCPFLDYIRISPWLLYRRNKMQ